jgi:hypothetical protein
MDSRLSAGAAGAGGGGGDAGAVTTRCEIEGIGGGGAMADSGFGGTMTGMWHCGHCTVMPAALPSMTKLFAQAGHSNKTSVGATAGLLACWVGDSGFSMSLSPV